MKKASKRKKQKQVADPFMVSLYLWGDKLDPELITARLGVKPTRTHRKGEKRPSISGTITEKTGLWHLKASTRSQALPDHIEELASKIKIPGRSIKKLPGVESAEIDIYAGYARNKIYKIGYKCSKGSDDAAFKLTEDNIAAIRRFGLPVEFTITITDS